MDETPAMRADVLARAGTLATFPLGTVPLLAGMAASKLYHGELSPYSTNMQEFVMQTSTKIVVDTGIEPGVRFTLADDQYVYTFSVSSLVADLTGWTQLDCKFISRAAI